MASKEEVLNAIRDCGQSLGRAPSRSEFKSHSGLSEYQVLQHFPSWREAVRAAGLEPDMSNIRLDDNTLLENWGVVVRQLRHIPTRNLYHREGKYSTEVFDKHFGPWSVIPEKFRVFAKGKPEWSDVLALLPVRTAINHSIDTLTLPPTASKSSVSPVSVVRVRHTKLNSRTTYGNPLDFRGLRHEPVNEAGVVLLFGMVARELGYLVEVVQANFPDCEAKRQVAPGKWQRVRIEFEFESRNFRDHGHPLNGCDVIVCWHHNWKECPSTLEIVELSSIIRNLAATDE